MIKPIRSVDCSPALAACQLLMQRFALWLCDPTVHGTDVTQANLQGQMPSPTEADWLWILLARSNKGQTLLDRARAVANLSGAEKLGLTNWVQAVGSISQHFSPAPPPALPCERPNGWGARGPQWVSFKTLMLAFYDPGLDEGLPYQCNGSPTDDLNLKVTYESFVREFRQRHRLDPHPHAHEVCVLCGRELRMCAVDHWVGKGAFPLLSVCPDNLLPVCGDCNAAPNKGQKDVHEKGVFDDWFHPYLRHANGTIHPRYDPAAFEIRVWSLVPANQQRVQNIDRLLNLGQRWTREFRGEYQKKYREVERYKAERAKHGQPPLGEADLREMLTIYRDRLSDRQPDFEVHRVVADVLLDPPRLQALLA